MVRFLLLAVVLLASGGQAAGADVVVFLEDGQVFTGDQIRHEDGLYFLDQGSRGILTIPAKLVREVRSPEMIDLDMEAAAQSAVVVEDSAETAVADSVATPEATLPIAAHVPPPQEAAPPHEAPPLGDAPPPQEAPSFREALPPQEASPTEPEVRATWYGSPFHGKPTASGDTYDMNALTAAHATLPFGTVVTVTNLNNGREVELTINDRVPRAAAGTINLSRAAAEQLDFVWHGSARVRVDIVQQ
jgi:rare lipoprotein A